MAEPRTSLIETPDNQFVLTVDTVPFRLTQFDFEQLAQQVLDRLQAILGHSRRRL